MATTNYSWNLPTVGGSEDTWGTSLNANWTALDTLLGGTNATEFAILDGATVTTAEFNYLSGVTSAVQTQINSKAASAITVSAGAGLTGGGDLTANRTLSHADTSSQGSVNNSGNTVIQDITLDTYGHITAIGSTTILSPILASCAFNGTSSGTISVEANGVNVANVTKNGTGDYTINFSSAVPHANYSVSGTSAWRNTDSPDTIMFYNSSVRTTSNVRVVNVNRAGGFSDSGLITVTIVG